MKERNDLAKPYSVLDFCEVIRNVYFPIRMADRILKVISAAVLPPEFLQYPGSCNICFYDVRIHTAGAACVKLELSRQVLAFTVCFQIGNVAARSIRDKVDSWCALPVCNADAVYLEQAG